MTSLLWDASRREIDESAYWDEVEWLSVWCVDSVVLNTTKTKELFIGYRKNKTVIQSLLFSGDCMERDSDFRFLGIHIDNDLTCSADTTALIKKAQQGLYFLRILRKNHLTEKNCLYLFTDAP